MAKPKKSIKTVEDVFNHFGADYDPLLSLEEKNRFLSRRIYKDTSCGAWGCIKVYPERKKRDGYYSAEYVKLDGVWTLLSIFRHDSREGEAKERIMVPNTQLHYYFWDHHNPGVMQVWLEDETEGTGKSVHVSEVAYVEWFQTTDKLVTAFRCGSIVEGSAAEVQAGDVRLPCSPDDLDAAVEYVEREVDALWAEAHADEEAAQ